MDWMDKVFVAVVVIGAFSAFIAATLLTIHVFKIGGLTIIGVH